MYYIVLPILLLISEFSDQCSEPVFSPHFKEPTSVSPFLSAQQVKEFFKLVEHFQASLLIMSAQCILWKRNLPHFSPLHTGSFGLTSL